MIGPLRQYPRFGDSGQPFRIVSVHVQIMPQHGEGTETMLKPSFVSQGVVAGNDGHSIMPLQGAFIL